MAGKEKACREKRAGFLVGIRGNPQLAHQIHSAGALDLARNAAVKLGGNTRHATWQNLAGLGGELREKLGVLVFNLLDRDIMPTGRHLAVRLTEIDSALNGLWFRHDFLAEFAVDGPALESRIELHLFQTTWSAEALLVARGHVA
jgi:hypothetical protein